MTNTSAPYLPLGAGCSTPAAMRAFTRRSVQPAFELALGSGPVDDRSAIIDLLSRYATIPDAKNWDGVYDVFADSVLWDFESLGAGPAATTTPQEILDWIKPGFTGCVATHHSITNHRIAVEGDQATIRAHIRAEHWIDEALAGNGPTCWLVVGFYDDEAIRTPNGWRLSCVRLTVNFQSGREAMQLAMVEGQRVLSAATHGAGS